MAKRKGSVRVLDGKVDLTDAVLLRVAPKGGDDYIEFLRTHLGYTESRLKELFGELLSTKE